MKAISSEKLKKYIPRFKNKRVLVVGDLMLDDYIWGKVTRISPEAPIPVIEVTKEETKPGGAANVVLNLISLGAKVYCAGVAGRDANAKKLLSYLNDRGVDTASVALDPARPTTVKTRVIAHHQQVVRIDKETRLALAPAIVAKIHKSIKKIMPKIDAIIFSDYNKGMITRQMVEEIIDMAKGRIIAVDPKPKNISIFSGITIITPNKKEASEGTNITIDSEEALRHAGMELMSMVNAKAVLVTRGEEGMSLFEHGEESSIPTVAKEVYDVTGAGDTVVSVVTLALAAGADFKEAAVMANVAAGIVVGEMGVATVTPRQLSAALTENE
jgi:D-glycero-beta-D-manno-heptose-7-phosphate kinase